MQHPIKTLLIPNSGSIYYIKTSNANFHSSPSVRDMPSKFKWKSKGASELLNYSLVEGSASLNREDGLSPLMCYTQYQVCAHTLSVTRKMFTGKTAAWILSSACVMVFKPSSVVDVTCEIYAPNLLLSLHALTLTLTVFPKRRQKATIPLSISASGLHTTCPSMSLLYVPSPLVSPRSCQARWEGGYVRVLMGESGAPIR